MGIKPALGWLALLLFTTTAQAEGSRELLRVPPKTKAVAAPPVTPKTKAPPLVAASAAAAPGSLVVIESGKAHADYEAEIYSGVPLDGALAKERGFDKGLVFMVFERERKPTFRVAQGRIRRVVRLAAEDRALFTASSAGWGITKPAPARPPREHLDVLETEDGVVVIESIVQNAGMFTTSDVYTFARGATLDQRVGALANVPAPQRARIRQALVIAEWTR